jgi:hypothetical protein
MQLLGFVWATLTLLKAKFSSFHLQSQAATTTAFRSK